MSVRFVGVQWNAKKIVYDVVMVLAVAAYIAAFTAIGRATLTGPQSISPAVLEMRAWGTCAFAMLTAILSIGPLARLSTHFAPLLYNRRHFGVLFFLVASTHAYKVLGFYHAYGGSSQLTSLLTNDAVFTRASLPFQLFGAAALVIFFFMAVTSHDFWQALLGPTVWKGLHMAVYLAYALVIAHVAFGALQWEHHPVLVVMVVGSVLWVGALHVLAARRSHQPDRDEVHWVEHEGKRYLDGGSPYTIPRSRARAVVVPGAERIALVRDGDTVSAVHGVCAHQGGPLYEGKVIDGCLTCPWHGWQYRPGDGCSPPPFQEKLPTYRLRLVDERVLVDPEPLPAGTATEPIVLEPESGATRE